VAQQPVAKIQHYVPQFLLRNFGRGKDQLYVFDKQTGRSFSTNTKNVAAKSRFYDFKLQGRTFTAEPALSTLEDKAKRLLVSSLLKADTLSVLSPDDRTLLSMFFAVQFTRTFWFRQQWRAFQAATKEKLRSTARTREGLESVEKYAPEMNENQCAIETVNFMLEAPNRFAIHFIRKIWVLLRTGKNAPFMIGDNPLALHNMRDMRPYGNIGLAVPGIEIYFPLSPMRALALWCPSHEAMFREAAERIASASRSKQRLSSEIQHRFALINQTLESMKTGRPLIYESENVKHFNSLQIRDAERYVFASSDDFSLAHQMIAEHPKARTGPRARFD
jgi:hypothetical protein